jgi:hypothetical protein
MLRGVKAGFIGSRRTNEQMNDTLRPSTRLTPAPAYTFIRKTTTINIILPRTVVNLNTIEGW